MIDAAVRCLVVAAEPALAAELGALAEDLPELLVVGSLAPLRAVAGRLPACDCVLVADPGPGQAPGLRQLVAGFGGRPAVVVTRGADLDAYRRALSAGARAVVALPAPPAALADAVADATAVAGSRGGAAARSGRVTAVAGAKGGVGATAIALALTCLQGATLVELAGARAGLAAVLGCRTERTLSDLAQVGEGLAAALDTATVAHASGVRLVAGPPGPELAAALPTGFAGALVRELRAASGGAVVDVGTAASPVAREVAAAADRVLLVTTPDAHAAACGCELVTALARWGVPADAVGIVVNRWNRRAELSLRGLSRAVGAPVVAAVGTDSGPMAALANGRARLDGWPSRRQAAALRGLVDEVPG